MICPTCANAADNRLGRDQHCNDDGTRCDCAHRTERYGQATEQIADTTTRNLEG